MTYNTIYILPPPMQNAWVNILFIFSCFSLYISLYYQKYFTTKLCISQYSVHSYTTFVVICCFSIFFFQKCYLKQYIFRLIFRYPCGIVESHKEQAYFLLLLLTFIRKDVSYEKIIYFCSCRNRKYKKKR